MSFEYKPTGKAFDFSLLRRIFSLISGYRSIFILSLILTLLVAGIGPFIPRLTQRTIDAAINIGNGEKLLFNCLVIMSLLILQGIVSYFQTFYTNWLGQQAILRLRNRIFQHILGLRLRVYDRTPVGTMITRTVSDVEAVADVFGEGLINISGDTLQIIVILVFMFSANWQLTLVSLSPFPVLIFSAWIFKEKVKVSFQEVRSKVSHLNAFLQEHITGMLIVQIFNRQKAEMEKFRDINAGHRDANIRGVLYYSIFFPVIEILSAIAIALIVWWGAKEILAAHASFGMLVAFIMFINLLFRPVRQIADKFNTLQMGMVAADRIFKVLDMEDATPDKGTIEKQSVSGQVSFNHVWFAYNDEDWVLRDVSFEVKPGEMLAIVGHTGAGKTSISNLVNRLYEYNKGSISIDGVKIEDFRLAELRRQIGIVLQDVFLFSDSIANNIRLFNDQISMDQMEEAAKLVGADSFIKNLPGGFHYQVQERGATLSTGQRQLISIIRAIIQDPRILILDEATSSIDPETEELVQHATQVLLQGRSSIVIAHRLATIQNANQIIVMEKGKIMERGRHQELLEQGGLYRKLYELQFTELTL